MASIFNRIYPQFKNFQTTDLATYIQALCGMVQPLSDLAATGDNGEDGWSALLDLTRVPNDALPWLGQLVGVRFLNPALSVTDQKNQIAARIGWQRGTLAAMQAAVAPLLSGSKTVLVVERDTSAYHFLITTFNSETPKDSGGVNVSPAVIAAIESQKPAGLQYTYSMTSGFDYTWVRGNYATYTTVRSTYATYNGLKNKTPGL
jgi:Phage tail protein (Tail_P2_I)